LQAKFLNSSKYKINGFQFNLEPVFYYIYQNGMFSGIVVAKTLENFLERIAQLYE